ncbi:hypothetical protein U7154_000145 [Kononvirus KKP3711]|uniref:Uncharacterized protein n=1 Tax=Enterobacter phage KKP_3711 TaxID=3109398 RepID=A0AAX4Q5Q9_9CAUD
MKTIIIMINNVPVLVIQTNCWQEFIDKLCSGALVEDMNTNIQLKELSQNWSNYKFSELENVWFRLGFDILSFKEVPIV